jgi:hypothetical protein
MKVNSSKIEVRRGCANNEYDLSEERLQKNKASHVSGVMP